MQHRSRGPQEKALMPEIVIREEPSRRVIAAPHRGPYPEIGPAFERLFGALGAAGLAQAAGDLVGIFHDDPATTAPEDLRSHAGVVVDEDVTCPEGLETLRLPGGRHAVLRVTGPYSALPPAYAWLYGEGLAAAGVTPRDGPDFEIYANDPADTPPEDLVTDIHVPLV
jgi:AraC family transcriptional regulator